MLKLYDYPRSTAAYRVRIALHHKGLEFETQPIHLLKDGGQQHHDTFKAINPQQLIPVLDDGAVRISQSLAIIEYLDEVHPGPRCLPESASERAYVRQLAQIVACDMHPLNNLRVLQFLKLPLAHSETETITWYHHWLARGFEALEAILLASDLRGACCLGDTPSLADMCLIPQLFNARRFDFDLKNYPTLTAIESHCLTLPAFQEASPS